MTPKIKREADGSLTVSVNVHLSGSMLEQEEIIAEAVNAVGRAATLKVLESLDSDGQADHCREPEADEQGEEQKTIRRRTGQ